ncbi:MAG: phosphopantetheine-binding protein, partial [Ilumatobacteraceae bacterium]
MTASDPRTHIVSALAQIAPDVDPDDLDADLHDDLGLDSMDLLNLAAAITDRSGVEIPERDY